jgi:cytochrome c6
MKSFIATGFALAGLLLASPVWAVDLLAGQRLYNVHCASCHGVTGIPVTPETPNLAMREGMAQPDMVLMQTLKVGKKAMPPYFGLLKDQDLLNIISYIRTMR